MSNSSSIRYSKNTRFHLITALNTKKILQLFFLIINNKTIFFLDTRPPAKPRRKRKSTTTNNTNTPGNNNNIPTTKDPNINHCTIPTPTKKRSPANTVYSQPAPGTMTPNMNNMPGVRRKIFTFKKIKYLSGLFRM
jgi:hypothetical protein